MENKKGMVQKIEATDQSAEMLISRAIDKNVSVETMEKLLAMRRELKEERAKELYDRAMAKFQAECPTITKTKEVKTNTGEVAYRYAPIESIVSQIKDALRNNGFSYSTNMKLTESGVAVSVKVTHEAGHSEVNEMSVPLGNKTQIMSQTQVVAAAQTFAKRYAFCNAFGILTGDEDTDAADKPENPPMRASIPVKPIVSTPNPAENGYIESAAINSQIPDDLKQPDNDMLAKAQEKKYCELHQKPLKLQPNNRWEHRAQLDAHFKYDPKNGLWCHCSGDGWHTSVNQK